MLPVFVAKVVEIAVGYTVGVKANEALNKGVKVIKNIVEAKKKEGK